VATKRVWKAEVFETEVNNKTFELRPLPLGELLKLEDAFRKFGDMSWTSIVAPESEDGEETEEWDFAKIKDNLLELGVEPLALAIPGFAHEDLLACPVGQVEFLFNLIMEVNGLDWLQDLAKNLITPLGNSLRRGATQVLADTLLSLTAASSETPSTES
jgi:hypothetical protein